MTLKIGKFKLKVNQKRSIYLSIALVFAFASFYLFNLGYTVANAAKITKLEKEINSFNHKVGEMESQLIAKRQGIDLEMAYSLGFKETGEIKFISKKSVATILGMDAL